MVEQTIRLDKWLWFARILKTRTLAQKQIKAGKVRVNREKITNPAKPVSPGETLTVTLARKILVLEIVACGQRRGPFVEAQLLYNDLTPAPLVETDSTKTWTGEIRERLPRPDKQARRKLLDLKRRQYFQ